ncbi:MAG TPA: hypothetical protein VFF40_07590 [Acidimicrobiia bacterium]|nr:hypothetical protein [Acidimicrobiia bacterium]
MPMRTQCRHYESRTYPSGEIVQKCRLDVAPEAPWRCPEDCSFFELRRFDAGWNHGSLGKPARRPEPEPVGEDVAALLDSAEDIVNAAAPEVLAEIEAQDDKRGFLRRGKKKNKKKKRR